MRRLSVILILGMFCLACNDEPTKVISLITESQNNSNLEINFIYNQIGLNERILYTGGSKLRNGDVKTNGIYIKRTSDTDIEYDYSQLINWKEDFNKKGTASIISDSDSLITIDNLKELSYKFKDSVNNRIIYITKSKPLNQTKSKLFDIISSDSSELMFYK